MISKKPAACLAATTPFLAKSKKGRQLARQLGFPTANVMPEAELLLPFGVYAVETKVEGLWRRGIANLGVRPTVETTNPLPSLEVHLHDWSGDLYGLDLEVKLGRFIRPEKKFASLEELKNRSPRMSAIQSSKSQGTISTKVPRGVSRKKISAICLGRRMHP